MTYLGETSFFVIYPLPSSGSLIYGLVSVMIFESVYWRKQDQTCFFTLESGSGRGEEAVYLLGRHGDFQEVSVKEAQNVEPSVDYFQMKTIFCQWQKAVIYHFCI